MTGFFTLVVLRENLTGWGYHRGELRRHFLPHFELPLRERGRIVDQVQFNDIFVIQIVIIWGSDGAVFLRNLSQTLALTVDFELWNLQLALLLGSFTVVLLLRILVRTVVMQLLSLCLQWGSSSSWWKEDLLRIHALNLSVTSAIIQWSSIVVLKITLNVSLLHITFSVFHQDLNWWVVETTAMRWSSTALRLPSRLNLMKLLL